MEHSGNPQRNQHPLANYQFTSDEMRVLRECNTESFFQRSLPFGTGLGIGAYFGVKNGFLTPNIKYGAVPKVVIAVIIGYFVGKFSYQQKCAEKLMRLPNSKLADLLKQRKQGGVMDRLATEQNLGVGLALAPFSQGEDIYTDLKLSDTNQSNSLNLDTEMRPSISGLDDIYRPSVDSTTTFNDSDLKLEPVKPGTTYEELRKINREEYSKKQQNPYSRPLPESAPVVVRHQDTNRSKNTQPIPQTNKYGDTWTD